MPGRMRSFPVVLTLAVFLSGISSGSALGQHSTQPFCDCAITPKHPDESKVDARFRSPRATLRTFLAAIMLAPDFPAKIEDAIACIDLSDMPEDVREREAGRLAYGLDTILRSIGVFTPIVPDHLDADQYYIARDDKHHVVLERQDDGRWVFDKDTVGELARMLRDVRRANPPNTAAAADVPAAYRTPRATYYTFFQAFRNQDMEAAAKCLDLSRVPTPARRALGHMVAVKIKEVFDRVALVLVQDVPDIVDGDPVSGLVRPEGRIALVRQESGERKGQWLFAAGTVEDIEEIYDAIEDEPVVPELVELGQTAEHPLLRQSVGLWFRSHLPEWSRQRFYVLGCSCFDLYQPFGLLLMALAGFLLRPLVMWLCCCFFRFLFKRGGVEVDRALVRAAMSPLGWMVLVGLMTKSVTWLDLRLAVAGVALEVMAPLGRVFAAVLAYRLVELGAAYLYLRKVAGRDDAGVTAMVLPVVSLVLRISVVVLGLVLVLRQFDLDVAAVLTGLGIGGVAVALAAQDTLKSFFGSLTLIADRTFKVGDQVRIGENEGVVESVGLRSTRIRGLDDSLGTIPNSQLSTMHIINYGARRYRRYLTTLQVAYGTPPETLEAFRAGLLSYLAGRPLVRQQESHVAVDTLGASAIEVNLSVFMNVANRTQELTERQALNLEVVRLADSLDMGFAAPVQKATSKETSKRLAAEAQGAAWVLNGPHNVPHSPHVDRQEESSREGREAPGMGMEHGRPPK